MTEKPFPKRERLKAASLALTDEQVRARMDAAKEHLLEVGEACELAHRGLEEVLRLREELGEYEALIAKQHTRVVEANQAWRTEGEGRELTLQDLGDLVQWLMNYRTDCLTLRAQLAKVVPCLAAARDHAYDVETQNTDETRIKGDHEGIGEWCDRVLDDVKGTE